MNGDEEAVDVEETLARLMTEVELAGISDPRFSDGQTDRRGNHPRG